LNPDHPCHRIDIESSKSQEGLKELVDQPILPLSSKTQAIPKSILGMANGLNIKT
jgi:hypothetical protein